MEARSIETSSVRTGHSKNVLERLKDWPRGVKTYFEELQTEMRRVTWPNWKQVRATTGVVIAAVFAFAAYFFLVDNVLGRAVSTLFDALAKR
jgi:preprotein translocase subunit SecE